MTRKVILTMILLSSALLAACGNQGAAQVGPGLGKTATLRSSGDLPGTPAGSTKGQPADAEVQSVVEGFGKQLQAVSLQSPTVAQDMEKAYSAYVSPELLQIWKNNPTVAPGRVVSSPWPDRIEITSLAQLRADRYRVDGYIIEISSSDAAGSGEAARTPIQLIVENSNGHWMITGYTGEY